jgi:TetR/AcrR family transcriptional regulator
LTPSTKLRDFSVRTKRPEQADKILCVAARLFATHRFHEARMEDIAAAAEVGKGTLYRYFKDKEELYTALLDRASAGLLRRIDEELAGVEGPREKLEALVTAILDYLDANPYLFDVAQHAEALGRPGSTLKMQKMRESNVRRTLAIIEEGRQAGLWDIPEPETAVLMLLGGLRAVLRFGTTPHPARLARRIIEDFLHGADRGPAACGKRVRAVEAAHG